MKSRVFDISSAASGLVSALQFTIMAITSISLSPRIHKLDRRRLALVSAVIVVISHLVAVVFVEWSTFIISRIGVAIGEGALFTIAIAAAAGLFLGEFVGKEIPWVHLDIAGPAYADEDQPLSRVGGTGHPTRTLLRYLEGLA